MENLKQESRAERELEVADVPPEGEPHGLPVFVAPGYENTFATFKNVMEELAKNGRRSLLVEHKRAKTLDSIDEQYSTEDLQRAFEIIEALDKKEISKTDAVGYSEGAIDVVVAASISPERFRNIVLLNPAGVIGNDSLAQLVARFSSQVLKDSVALLGDDRKAVWNTYMSAIPEILKNPKLAVKEAISVAGSDTLPALAKLKEGGVSVSIIAGVDDKALPMERMQKAVKTKHITGFYSVRGGHIEVFKNPKEHTRLIAEALSAMERKAEQADSL